MFPQEYPLKPPGIMMITPNGRFIPKHRICMSISDYHPETWNPIWKVETIMMGLVSFMTSDEFTAGSVNTSTNEKKKLAAASLKWNYDNDKKEGFVSRFKLLFPKMGIDEDKLEESKEMAKENQKEENKKSFFVAVAIALGISFLVSKKFGGGGGGGPTNP